jgi:hypothetical protein
LLCPAGAVDIWPVSTSRASSIRIRGDDVLPTSRRALADQLDQAEDGQHLSSGEYGAILDGSGYWPISDDTQAAFRAHNEDIDYVTIRISSSEACRRVASIRYYWMSDHWTIEYNEIASNKMGIEFAPNFHHPEQLHPPQRGAILVSNPAERGGGYTGVSADNTTFDSNEIAYNGPEQKVGTVC